MRNVKATPLAIRTSQTSDRRKYRSDRFIGPRPSPGGEVRVAFSRSLEPDQGQIGPNPKQATLLGSAGRRRRASLPPSVGGLEDSPGRLRIEPSPVSWSTWSCRDLKDPATAVCAHSFVASIFVSWRFKWVLIRSVVQPSPTRQLSSLPSYAHWTDCARRLGKRNYRPKDIGG
jgi:hypothetical protein